MGFDGKNIISLKSVCKSFGKNEVLKNVSLDVSKGETLVVLGKSGTGKSVILQCIIGLMKPDSGIVEVFGKNIFEMPPAEFLNFRKRTGFLFQSGALYDSMSIRENLEFPLIRHFNPGRDVLNEKVTKSLDEVGLLKSIDKMPSELSGGMKKRAGLARTLILEPEILLYDEPTTGLDPATSRDISRLIRSVQKERNMTSVVVTHDMECVRMTADRIAVLKDGAFTVTGIPEEIMKAEDEYVKSFFN
ncbi:MAG: ATP-binding cassette domain-containing protein [Bacteroidetes bacterium]|nr:ATP-binding cassette domain-containing protein [Bacteroidota bacterium]